MEHSQRAELRRIITGLPISAARLAQEHKLQKQHISNLVNDSGYVSPALTRRIVAAVRKEAAKAGAQFPDERFVEYLGHDENVA